MSFIAIFGWLIGGAGKLIQGLFAFLRTLPPAVLGLLAVALFAGVQTYRVDHISKQRDLAVMQVRRMTYVLNESRLRIERAGAKAKAAADATNAINETRREKANAALQSLADDYRARTDAYVRRMRFSTTNLRYPSVLPLTPEDPKVPDSPDQTADIPISRVDLDILVENTARLKNAHEWAIPLFEQDPPQ